jgi:hypothetical protein
MSTNFIIVRLLPSTPLTAKQFHEALSGLSITAYDRSIANPSPNVVIGENDTLIGQASGHVVAGTPLVVKPATATTPKQFESGIIQHIGINPNGVNVGKPVAVATAAIIVDLSSSYPEYPSPTAFDVRFDVERTDKSNNTTINIPVPEIDYNIICASFPLTLDSLTYAATNASTFTYIPEAPDSNLPSAAAYVKPSPAGLPPSFKDLYGAIDQVLKSGDHPTTAPSLENLTVPLTVAQSSEIASEIIYNRWINPPPTPPGPQDNSAEANLENMYTYPNNLNTVNSKDNTSQTWVRTTPASLTIWLTVAG